MTPDTTPLQLFNKLVGDMSWTDRHSLATLEATDLLVSTFRRLSKSRFATPLEASSDTPLQFFAKQVNALSPEKRKSPHSVKAAIGFVALFESVYEAEVRRNTPGPNTDASQVGGGGGMKIGGFMRLKPNKRTRTADKEEEEDRIAVVGGINVLDRPPWHGAWSRVKARMNSTGFTAAQDWVARSKQEAECMDRLCHVWDKCGSVLKYWTRTSNIVAINNWMNLEFALGRWQARLQNERSGPNPDLALIVRGALASGTGNSEWTASVWIECVPRVCVCVSVSALHARTDTHHSYTEQLATCLEAWAATLARKTGN